MPIVEPVTNELYLCDIDFGRVFSQHKAATSYLGLIRQNANHKATRKATR